MAKDPLFYVVAIACLVVLGILTWGIGTFGKGGEDSGKKANKIIQQLNLPS